MNDVCLYQYLHMVNQVPATALVHMQGLRDPVPMCGECARLYQSIKRIPVIVLDILSTYPEMPQEQHGSDAES